LRVGRDMDYCGVSMDVNLRKETAGAASPRGVSVDTFPYSRNYHSLFFIAHDFRYFSLPRICIGKYPSS
jgi:hypothetical protein